MLDAERFVALVVGGGTVAERKTRQLLASGARVKVVAPEIDVVLHTIAAVEPRLSLERRRYERRDLDDVNIVIAATNDEATNAAIAQDALGLGRLVNVVDDPAAGNFITCAIHRSGDLTVGVSAGGVPAAASAIAADIRKRFDGRYAKAIAALRELRGRLLGSGKRDDWKRASDELIGHEFVADVEAGRIEPKVSEWR
jgi:precorrin-2 dehydrogenase/sirohydrochlorin ferrochelatase